MRVGDTPAAEAASALQPVVIEGLGSLMLYPAGDPAASVGVSKDPVMARVRRAVVLSEVEAWLAERGDDPFPQPTSPPAPYLSEEYFRRYEASLDFAAAHRMTAILYDELDYPSGYAGGGRIDPSNFRKLIARTVVSARPGTVEMPEGELLAAIEMSTSTRERRDLTSRVVDGRLDWSPPGSEWNLQLFTLVTSEAQGGPQDYHAVVDYLDPATVQHFIDITYEAYARHVGHHLGSTITATFFDDVGIYSAERTWGRGVAERFRERTGRSPAVYYPALWEDIGTDTTAARIAFFAARAELLGEGFPALVSAWGDRHGLDVSGHCPGQYEIQPTDMNGDPFAFYRAQAIPMIDVIYKYGFGREGFKLTTSAADTMDKPIVLAEQFTTRGTTMGYRRSMDSFVRGVNWLVAVAGNEIGSPTTFAEWAGRISMLLQGGRRVADIAVIYPIASLQAFYSFEAPDNQEGPVGRYAPPSADYLAVGDRLTRELHRDFTFIHPDDLVGDRIRVEAGRLVLANAENRQAFSVVILPGSDAIPLVALEVIQRFQDSGGTLIGTSALPRRSAEFGRDAEVADLVDVVFKRATFIEDPSTSALDEALARLAPAPDVRFTGAPRPHGGNGHLAYIHKVKAGREIFYIANSSDDLVTTEASLRGALELEFWDPLTGTIEPAPCEVTDTDSGPRTAVPLELGPVSSMLLVGRRLGED